MILVPKQPIFKAFVTLEGPKWLAMGSKWAHFTCLCTPNGLGSFLEKHIFDPFFGPKTAHFQGILGPKGAPQAQNAPKTLVFGIPCGLSIIFEKTHFFAAYGPC